MKILLADQHETICIGLRSLIYDIWPDAKIMEARDLNEVVKLISSDDINLAIIDISLPGAESLEEFMGFLALEAVIVIFAAGESDVNQVQRLLLAGADQFIPAHTPIAEIRSRLAYFFN